MPQDRRQIAIPTTSHEKLTGLQYHARVLMNEQKVKNLRSKTSITNIIGVLAENVTPEELVELLK